MKLSIKPLAIAVAVGLASTAAHAQLANPVLGTAAPSLTGLYVSIWDTASQHSELVNLGFSYSQLLPSSGGLTPSAAAGGFTQVGNSLVLDFGVLPGFTSTFGTPGTTTSYMVLAANAQSGADFTGTPANAAALTQVGTVATNIGAQVANWEQTTDTLTPPGTAIDLTGTKNYNAISGPNGAGNLGLSGFNFSGTVGSALDFFNLVPGASRGSLKLTQYANSVGAGVWNLSTGGDLTWTVPASASPVPLPAAVWLLVSGLAGLGAIGRRRNVAAA